MSFRYILICLFWLIHLMCISGQEQVKSYTFPNDKLDSTLFHFKKQLEIVQRKDQTSLIGLRHWELGDFYYSVGVFSEAMDQFNKALSHTKAQKDTLHVLTKNSIGLVELSLRNYDQAKIYFMEAFQESLDLNYVRGQAFSKGYIGSCLEKEGDYENALKYQIESLELFEVLNATVDL